MRSLLLVLLLLMTLSVAAQGAQLKLDITYTNGQILSGPLSADLTELPASVLASFTLSGAAAGNYTLGEAVESTLAFGDGVWSLGDLESFTTTLLDTDVGSFAVAALTYAYRPINTPTVDGRLAANFPLSIQGTDIATGQAFHYQYDTSSQTVTIVPEPASFVLLGVAACMYVRLRRSALRVSEVVSL